MCQKIMFREVVLFLVQHYISLSKIFTMEFVLLFRKNYYFYENNFHSYGKDYQKDSGNPQQERFFL